MAKFYQVKKEVASLEFIVFHFALSSLCTLDEIKSTNYQYIWSRQLPFFSCTHKKNISRAITESRVLTYYRRGENVLQCTSTVNKRLQFKRGVVSLVIAYNWPIGFESRHDPLKVSSVGVTRQGISIVFIYTTGEMSIK